jgi:hypothetical protein
VPAHGKVAMTFALTGFGTAYIDDVRIEPLVGGAAYCPPTVTKAEAPANAVRPAAAVLPVRK